jgi:uncharacterized protein YyaL (SSP411 family)
MKVCKACYRHVIERQRPSADDKIILGWNALLLTAFCKAYAATNNTKYKAMALDLYQTIFKNFL